jgi:hypothetical protein
LENLDDQPVAEDVDQRLRKVDDDRRLVLVRVDGLVVLLAKHV